MADDNYVCSLDAASIKKAKKELFETPEDRLSAVQALRQWVEEQPHIKYDKTDTNTLLRFLRWAKFSQLRAREMLEGTLRLKIEQPVGFQNVDTHDPEFVKLISTGFNFFLPKRTPEGCAVMVHRMALFEPHQYKDYIGLWHKFVSIATYYISCREDVQVNGLVILIDFTNFKSIVKFMNPEMAKFQKIWQKRIPLRFKEINHYNAGLMFDTLMGFFKPFIAKKFLGRLFTHDTAESLYKKIPMDLLPIEYLPDDYTGPNAGTCKALADHFCNEVMSEEFRKEFLYRTGPLFAIDDSLSPVQVQTEHFRKLNVE